MDAEVGAWEPPVRLSDRHARTLDEAETAGDRLVVDEDAANCLRDVVNAEAEACSAFFAGASSHRLIAWLRVLTLAERSVAGCDVGAKSPVIVLARMLRERGDYPGELTAWIKSVSSNRFLPYGSLMDRLNG
ncbi:MAG: hypothetical protein J4F38_11230 [Pseudomonadales bacterium]|nr:hypothetical protein [Pseudomonadales bacterium]